MYSKIQKKIQQLRRGTLVSNSSRAPNTSSYQLGLAYNVQSKSRVDSLCPYLPPAVEYNTKMSQEKKILSCEKMMQHIGNEPLFNTSRNLNVRMCMIE
jgi:hypothetical protein